MTNIYLTNNLENPISFLYGTTRKLKLTNTQSESNLTFKTILDIPQTTFSTNFQDVSKLVMQKDAKIKKMSEKLKSLDKQVNEWKARALGAQYQLVFFKQKIQQEFAKNHHIEQQIEEINLKLNGFIRKIFSIFEQEDDFVLNFQSFLKKLPLSKNPSLFETDYLSESTKLIHTLQFQINEVTKPFLSLKNEHKISPRMQKSVQLNLKSSKQNKNLNRQVLKIHILELIGCNEKTLNTNLLYNEKTGFSSIKTEGSQSMNAQKEDSIEHQINVFPSQRNVRRLGSVI